MRAQVAQHRRHDVQFAEASRRGDVQRPARRGHGAGGGIVGLHHRLQNGAAIGRVALAGFPDRYRR